MGNIRTKQLVAKPVLPLKVVRRNLADVVVDATGAVVSIEYWTLRGALAAKDRLTRAASFTTRPCITCRKPFESEGIHNRMCGHCRNQHRAGL